jgi:hypothetical protein
MGLLGMAYFSAPSSSSSSSSEYTEVQPEESAMNYQGLRNVRSDEDFLGIDEDDFGAVDESLPTNVEPADTDDDDDDDDDDIVIVEEPSELQSTHVLVFGKKWERRTLGILSAMFTGIYGGSIMVPMKWAPKEDKGVGYLISFAIGAALVNLVLWIFRYLYLCQRHSSFSKGYYALPSFHFRKMWLYGGTSGLLWSIGNFFSIISVEFLGEGVGYSVVQSSMLGMCL